MGDETFDEQPMRREERTIYSLCTSCEHPRSEHLERFGCVVKGCPAAHGGVCRTYVGTSYTQERWVTSWRRLPDYSDLIQDLRQERPSLPDDL